MSEIEYMLEDGESEKSPKGSSHRRREANGQKKSPRGEKGNRRHSMENTREEMERGREEKNGGKGHWTVNFRGGY